MRLVTALLVKDEADRYLTRVLQRCQEFSDAVLVLDDRSSDETPKIAKDLGCVVRTRSILQDPAWGKEAPARAELWDWAAQEAQDGWVLFCDADMLFQGNPRDLCWSTEVNSWAMILFDVWDAAESVFRFDGPWMGHRTPRPWLVRPEAFGADYKPLWPQRGIHTGHIPANAPLMVGVAPPDTYYWLHLQYATPESRQRKYEAYRAVAPQLTEFEKMHAETILT